MAKHKTLTDQLRQALDDSGLTRYEIAKQTGIDQSILSRFYNGERGISNAVMDKLGEFLGLEIVAHRKRRRG